MEKEVLEFLGGIFLIGIMPMMKGQLFNKAVLSKRLNQNIVFEMILSTVIVWSVINQNSDILIGTIIGSSLFQILVLNGVNKLIIQEEVTTKITFHDMFKREKLRENSIEQENQVKYRSGGQYLIFSVIFLLFLSADYLLKGKYVRNVLNQVDGGILIILFVTYLYLMKDSEKIGIIQKILNKIGKYSKDDRLKEERNYVDSKLEQKEERKQCYISICMYLLLEMALLLGGFFLVKSVSSIGVSFGISQYGIGLTLMAWCVNISSILLSNNFVYKSNIEKDKLSNRSMNNLKVGQNKFSGQNEKRLYSNNLNEMNFEEIMRNTIFSITLLLGVAVLIRPIFINTFIIYNLIIFGVAALLVQLAEKIDNRLAGSSMAAVYIGFILYMFNTLS